VNHIENRRAMPGLVVLDRIARALGSRRLSELLGTDESKTL